SIRVYNLGYYIRFFPSAITWEQEPENLKVWWKQRTRWARGNLYVIFKYLFGLNKLVNKKVFIDLSYFLFTYFLFFGGVLLSDILLVVIVIVCTKLSIRMVSYVLLLTGFLLYASEVCLALAMERNQLTIKDFWTVVFM